MREDHTFGAKSRSLLGVAEDGGAVLEDFVGAAELELPDEAEVFPGAAAAVVDLVLQSNQLLFLSFAHHLQLHCVWRRTKAAKPKNLIFDDAFLDFGLIELN